MLNIRIVMIGLALCATTPALAQPASPYPYPYPYYPPASNVVVVPPPTEPATVVVVPPVTTGDVVVVPALPSTPVPEPEAAEKCRYVADFWSCVNSRNGGG